MPNQEISNEIDSIHDHIIELKDEQKYLGSFIKLPEVKDSMMIEFNSSRGLTFLAIYKAGYWWVTTTIGLEANRKYSDLPGLLLAFQPETVTVLRRGNTYGG
jgi:hypothetical protein